MGSVAARCAVVTQACALVWAVIVLAAARAFFRSFLARAAAVASRVAEARIALLAGVAGLAFFAFAFGRAGLLTVVVDELAAAQAVHSLEASILSVGGPACVGQL